jgi:AmiR/NasT family two-component response regulator
VLQDRTGSDANPALLCYVRKGKDLVDTLHREVYEMELAMKGSSDIDMSTDTVESKEDVEMTEHSIDVPDLEKPLIDLGDELPASNDKPAEERSWVDDL